MKKIKIEIAGMHCASCASNVERSLKKIPAVKNASVSVLLNTGRVECEDNITEEELVKAVKRAGYNVRKIIYD